METREALTMALSTYSGAVLIVSHDRHLLRATTDRLILVHEGKVTPFDGDLDDYAELILEHRRTTTRQEKEEARAQKEPVINKKEARRLEAQERQRIAALRAPLQKELTKVEKAMAKANEELAALDARLANPNFYNETPNEEVAAILKAHGELKPLVEELEMKWLELSEEIETIS